MLININQIKKFFNSTTNYRVKLPHSPKEMEFTKYVRPENYRSETFLIRFRNAYGVLTGKYDALSWENLYKEIKNFDDRQRSAINTILCDSFCEIIDPKIFEYFLYVNKHELSVIETYIELAKSIEKIKNVVLHCFYDYDSGDLRLDFKFEFKESDMDVESYIELCDHIFSEFFKHAQSDKIILS